MVPVGVPRARRVCVYCVCVVNTTFKRLQKQDEGAAGARRMADLLALALQV